MQKFDTLLLLLMMTLLSGCGEVVVFGHVVREGHAKTEVKQDATPTAVSSSSASSSSAAASSSRSSTSASATPIVPATPPITPSQPATPAALTAVSAVASEPDKAPAIQPVAAVNLAFTPEVTDKLVKDSRVNTDDLLNAIKTELQSRGLLVDNKSDNETQKGTTLVVYVDNYDLHANTNFVIFGVTPHTGTLAGNLMLRDEQGNDVPLAHVEAYSRISVPQGDAPKTLLQPLYKDFAITVANSLAGTHVLTGAEKEQAPR